MKQLLWVALVLSMLAALPAASGIGSITVDSVVNPDSTVHTTMTVRFDSPVASFSHPLHSGIVDLEASGDFEKADCRVIPRTVASEIYCDLVGITPERNILTLEFNTLDSVRKVDATYLYTITFGVSTPTNDSFIIVRLPESGVLAADIPNQSYSPQDGSVFSDGRHIGIFWQRDRLNPGDSLQFSVNYRVSEQAGALSQFLIVVAVVAMIIAAGAVVYFRQGRFRRHADIVRTVLNEDEKGIIDILEAHKGTAMQRLIVRETDFSKAKVTRIVKSLKERGVVNVEHIGRTNRVTLKMREEKPKEEKKE